MCHSSHWRASLNDLQITKLPTELAANSRVQNKSADEHRKLILAWSQADGEQDSICALASASVRLCVCATSRDENPKILSARCGCKSGGIFLRPPEIGHFGGRARTSEPSGRLQTI